jgi:hypothetical protein
MIQGGPTKTVGKHRSYAPEECFRRADELQRFAERFSRFPKPRGFVFKAKTYEEYERWRRSQSNPRLW